MPTNPTDSTNRPTTPPKRDAVSIQETPRSARSNAEDINLTRLREQIAVEMDSEMITCDVQTFRNVYLPFVPLKSDVDNCLELLHKAGCLEGDPIHWTKFRSKPSKVNGLEAATFAPIGEICDKLAEYELVRQDVQDNIGQPHFSYVQDPNRTTASELSGSNHKIDAFFKPTNSTTRTTTDSGRFITSAVATIIELKRQRNDGTIHDNRLKVLSAASHIMNDDPRRMFTYGITIEDEMLSLWYFSRSHSAMSHSFDWTQDCETFVSVLLSFMFATEKEMGFDPSIMRHDKGEKIFYVIQVAGRYFKTLRTISEYRSLRITGRMTRVWEAIEVESPEDLQPKEGASPVILKDVWLDSTARTEKEIQQAIFADIQDFASRLDALGSEDPLEFVGFDDEMKVEIRSCLKDGKYKKHFLDIVCDKQGEMSKEIPSSAQPTKGLFTLPSIPSQPQSQLDNADPSRGTSEPIYPVQDLLSVSSSSPSPKRQFGSKRQYRVVFREVCNSLHDLVEIPKLFHVFLQCLTILQLLYCAHWVHRDISSGNVLYYEHDGSFHAILGDLEYAKKYNSGSGNTDPKTGTLFFMAIEVQTSRLFIKPEPGIEDNPDDPRLFVRHNFQHDLESLWWLQLWFLTSRVDHNPCRTFVSSVFVNSFHGIHARIRAFVHPLTPKLMKYLHPDLRSLAMVIDDLRYKLHQAYRARELEDKVDDIGSYSSSYADMRRYFLDILTNISSSAPPLLNYQNRKENVISETVPQRKRRRSNNDEDEYQPGSADEDSDGLQKPKPRGKGPKVHKSK